MFKRLLPVAVCFLLAACAGTAGVVTPPCTHCAHNGEHRCMDGERCLCDTPEKHDAQQADKPCEICQESERASAAR